MAEGTLGSLTKLFQFPTVQCRKWKYSLKKISYSFSSIFASAVGYETVPRETSLQCLFPVMIVNRCLVYYFFWQGLSSIC